MTKTNNWVLPGTKRLKINILFYILGNAIRSIDDRFALLQEHYNHFSFLYNIHDLKQMSDNAIKNYCSDLDLILPDGESKDIDGEQLYDEIKSL